MKPAPASAPQQLRHVWSSCSVASSNRSVSLARGRSRPNFPHLLRRELMAAAQLGSHVVTIVRHGAEEQVRRIHTRRIVAPVKNAERWPRTVREKPDCAMGELTDAVNSERPVPEALSRPFPQPAVIGLLDLLPKAIAQRSTAAKSDSARARAADGSLPFLAKRDAALRALCNSRITHELTPRGPAPRTCSSVAGRTHCSTKRPFFALESLTRA